MAPYPSPSQHHVRQPAASNSAAPPLNRPAHLSMGYVRPTHSPTTGPSPSPLSTNSSLSSTRHSLPAHTRPSPGSHTSGPDPRTTRRNGSHSQAARLSLPSPTLITIPSPVAKPGPSQPSPLPSQPHPTAPQHPTNGTKMRPVPATSAEEQYQLGLAGPQAWGHMSAASGDLNPWRGCSPCKWKIPLVLDPPLGSEPLDEMLTEEMPEADDRALILSDKEWSIKWARLEWPDRDTGGSDFQLQLDRSRLTYVMGAEPEEVWVYEIPGQLVPKQTLPSPADIQETVHKSDPASSLLTTPQDPCGVAAQENTSTKNDLIEGLDLQRCKCKIQSYLFMFETAFSCCGFVTDDTILFIPILLFSNSSWSFDVFDPVSTDKQANKDP